MSGLFFRSQLLQAIHSHHPKNIRDVISYLFKKNQYYINSLWIQVPTFATSKKILTTFALHCILIFDKKKLCAFFYLGISHKSMYFVFY